MKKILPRRDTKMQENLAGAVPLGLFILIRDETGDISYRPSYGSGGTLCELKVSDPSAKGFYVTRKALKPVRGLNESYRTIDLDFDSEADFKLASLEELVKQIPTEERGSFTHYQPIFLGRGNHGECIAKINLYERR